MRRAPPALRASWVSANVACIGQGEGTGDDGLPTQGGGLIFVAQGGFGTVNITGSNATGIYAQAREPFCACARAA